MRTTKSWSPDSVDPVTPSEIFREFGSKSSKSPTTDMSFVIDMSFDIDVILSPIDMSFCHRLICHLSLIYVILSSIDMSFVTTSMEKYVFDCRFAGCLNPVTPQYVCQNLRFVRKIYNKTK